MAYTQSVGWRHLGDLDITAAACAFLRHLHPMLGSRRV